MHIAFGIGPLCKVCNQMVSGGTLAAVSEAFRARAQGGCRSGSRSDGVLGGFASSRVLDAHGERILVRTTSRDFRNSTSRRIWHRGRIRSRVPTPAPVAAVVQQLVTALVAAGHADRYSALATVLFDLAVSTDDDAARTIQPRTRRATDSTSHDNTDTL